MSSFVMVRPTSGQPHVTYGVVSVKIAVWVDDDDNMLLWLYDEFGCFTFLVGAAEQGYFAGLSFVLEFCSTTLRTWCYRAFGSWSHRLS